MQVEEKQQTIIQGKGNTEFKFVYTDNDITEAEIQEQFLKAVSENRVNVFFNDITSEHYIIDFPLFEKNGKKFWCASLSINNELTKWLFEIYV